MWEYILLHVLVKARGSRDKGRETLPFIYTNTAIKLLVELMFHTEMLIRLNV